MRTTQNLTLHGRPGQLSLGSTLKHSFLAVDRLLATWQARQQHREQLRRMPGYLLRDVGLTDEQVLEESRKPFWRA